MSELIPFKHKLAEHVFVFSLIKKLILQVKEIENHAVLKLSPQLTEWICSKIKEEVSYLKQAISSKVDSREVAKEVLKQVFSLTDDEMIQVDSQLDYMIDNKLIKSVSLKKRIKVLASSLLPKL